MSSTPRTTTYESNGSPFGDAFDAFMASESPALAVYSDDTLDCFESCAYGLTAYPAHRGDASIVAFATACAATRAGRWEAENAADIAARNAENDAANAAFVAENGATDPRTHADRERDATDVGQTLDDLCAAQPVAFRAARADAVNLLAMGFDGSWAIDGSAIDDAEDTVRTNLRKVYASELDADRVADRVMRQARAAVRRTAE